MLRFVIALLLPLAASAAKADLVILQYHHVSDETPAVTSISPAMFAQHLELLEQQDMQVVSLPYAIKTLQNGGALPTKAVAITFDDAYISVYQNAFPLLKKRHWPFTVFVNPGPTDRNLPDISNWDQLREMQAAGATIANHTMEHPYLIERPSNISLDAWMTAQVEKAEQRIKQETGQNYRYLAFPYGEYSLEIAEWLKDHDYVGFGQQSGPAGIDSWWQAVPRFPAAGQYADPETLKNKLKTLAFKTANKATMDPILELESTDGNPPRFQMTVSSKDIKPESIQCFASNAGKIEVDIATRGNKTTVTATSPKAITAGRGRYNCTAPSLSQPGYFYWHSQLWINTSVSNR